MVVHVLHEVWSRTDILAQEELDHIVSQLTDLHNNGVGPPPAVNDAIQALSKKSVDSKMLGADMTRECSICMDIVEIGTEGTILAYHSWFHSSCIASWLGLYNSCRYCRRGIDFKPEEAPCDRNP